MTKKDKVIKEVKKSKSVKEYEALGMTIMFYPQTEDKNE